MTAGPPLQRLRAALIALLVATGAASALASPMTEAERRVADAAVGVTGAGITERAGAAFGHALGPAGARGGLGIVYGHELLFSVESANGIGRGYFVPGTDRADLRSRSGSIAFFRFDTPADRDRFLSCRTAQVKGKFEPTPGAILQFGGEHDFSCSGSGSSLAASGYTYSRLPIGNVPAQRHYSCLMARAVGTRFAVGLETDHRSCEDMADAGGLLSAMQSAALREIQALGPALERQWPDVAFALTPRDRAAIEALSLSKKPALRIKAMEKLPHLRNQQSRPIREIGFEQEHFVKLAGAAQGGLRGFTIGHYHNGQSSVDLIVLARPGSAAGFAAAAARAADGDRECYRAVDGRYVLRFFTWYGVNCAAQQGQAVRHMFDTLEAALSEAIGPLPDDPVATPREPPRLPPPDQQRPGQVAVAPPDGGPAPTSVPGAGQDPAAPPQDDPDSLNPPDDSPTPPDPTTDRSAPPELTPAEIAAVTGLTGGIALLGALSMLSASGVRRQEVIEELRGLLRGRPSPDPFEAWKAKYEALGWTYSEKNGVATFDPVDGARNEAGEIYSREKGGFVRNDGASQTASALPPQDGAVNERGEVWSENDRAFVQRDYYEQERKRLRDLEARRAGEIAQAERISRTEADAFAAETARRAQDIADSMARREAVHAAEQALRDRLAGKLRIAGADASEIERLRSSGDTLGLRQLYADHLNRMMDAETAEAIRQKRWADVMAAGEYASKATLAAAKAGMMVVGGPAGTLAVAGGLGAIGSVEEGARAIVAGASARQVAGAFATGFLSGAKDGAIGRYVNLPGMPAATRIALPAAADAAEAYARTGDIRTAVAAGALSAAGGSAGQGLGRLGSTMAREGAQVALGGVMGAAGRATTDGNVTEGFLDGLASGIGSSVGGHAAKAGVARAEPLPLPGSETFRTVRTEPKLTAADIQLDADAAVRKTRAQGLVDDLRRAVASGTPDEQKAALTRVLENRDAKLMMKGAEVDAPTKVAFADLAEQHRTRPVFAATADHLNQQKGADGAQRFVVREPDPANPGGVLERKVLPTDFRSTSGTAGKAPGMDLDMTANATIIDRATGRPARAADLDAAVGGACSTLGISKTGQEINLMHGESLERYTLRPGEDPAKFIPRVASGNVTGAEGRSLAEVTGAKLAEADVLHTGAGAVSEKCRIAAKDFDRITRPLMEAKSGARLPPVFAVRDATTGETPLDIMRAVANNDMPPGTGNARFRALTGMDLSAGADKLAQMPEFVAKFGATGSGAATPGSPDPVLSAGEAARAALRQALRLGSDR